MADELPQGCTTTNGIYSWHGDRNYRPRKSSWTTRLQHIVLLVFSSQSKICLSNKCTLLTRHCMLGTVFIRLQYWMRSVLESFFLICIYRPFKNKPAYDITCALVNAMRMQRGVLCRKERGDSLSQFWTLSWDVYCYLYAMGWRERIWEVQWLPNTPQQVRSKVQTWTKFTDFFFQFVL